MSSAFQASCQGQSLGRCRTRRRAERASRAGRLIRCARMVAVVALAWKIEAIAPAARVRLNAIAASTSQAPFGANDPEVIWSLFGGVHDVRDGVSSAAGRVVDAVTLRCPLRRRKAPDEGAARSHAGLRGGVLDGPR